MLPRLNPGALSLLIVIERGRKQRMRGLLLIGFIAAALPTVFVDPYIGVLLFCWVSFMNPQRVVYGIGSDMQWAMIIGVITIVAWACSRESKRPSPAPTYWLIVAFLVYISLTTVFALSSAPNVFQEWELTAKMLVFVLITMTLTTNRIRVQALVWVMVISIGFYAVKGGLFTLITGGAAHVYGPADSMIADNNQFAVAMLVAAPLMNYLRVTSEQRFVRWGLAMAMALSLIAVLGSYSRGGLLALAAESVFLWSKSRRKLMPTLALIGVIVAGLVVMPSQWGERMRSIDDYHSDASAEGRLAIWGAAIKIAEARPLVGGGFKATTSPQVVERYAPGVHRLAAHSIYFEVLAEQGFVALAIWLAIPIATWRNCRWIIRHTRDLPEWDWAGALARMGEVSLVAYLVGGAFLSLGYWDYYFTLVALLAATRVMLARAFAAREPVAGKTADQAQMDDRLRRPILPASLAHRTSG